VTRLVDWILDGLLDAWLALRRWRRARKGAQ
jgi:hypothetical protein